MTRSSQKLREMAIRPNREAVWVTPCGTAPPESLLTAFVNDPELPAKELLPDIVVALKAGLTAGAVARVNLCLDEDGAHARRMSTALQRVCF
jgi:hypothetical protein